MDELPRERALDLGDYMAILRRRKAQLFVPFVLILAVSLLLAFGLPPLYRSEATILIERQEIPTELVATTVTGYVEERIEGITKRLLTVSNLWDIAEKLDLYPEERDLKPKQDIVQSMRENIEIEMVDVDTREPNTGKQKVATIAFTISFAAHTPEAAQQGTTELAELFLEENRRNRREHAQEVSSFLAEEADKLNNEISELESKLAAFKQEQREHLPELLDVNLRLFEQTENKIEQTVEEIRSLEDRITTLRAELAITNPYKEIITGQGQRVLTESEQLSVLTTEYLRASSRYSPNHPDLIKLRREIEALRGQTGSAGEVSEIFKKLTVLRSELSEARRKYSEEHPDVKKLKQSIAALEKGLRHATLTASTNASDLPKPPDNPRYVSLKAELLTVVRKLKSENAQRNQLQEKLREYEARLFRTPAVERDYNTLSRDYENARQKYAEIKDKQLKARLAVQLEETQQAERFTIVEPADLPGNPWKPNRLGVVLLGGLLAFSSGIGSVAFVEYTDRTVRGFRGVTAVLQAPPLAGIPYIRNSADKVRRRNRRLAAAYLILIMITLTLSIVHYFWQPLGELWLQVADAPERFAPNHATIK